MRKLKGKGNNKQILIPPTRADQDSGRQCRIRSESGRSLPAALITLAVGSLLLTPFLSFISSRALGSRAAGESFMAQYAADAGIEYGIWSILYAPVFRSQVDNNLGTPQTLAFPAPLNGFTPVISVTGLPIGSWSVQQSAPANIDRGGALAYSGGDRIYALRGNNNRSFGYYSISADQWFSLANTPATVQRGGALIYDGSNFIYAFRGRNTDAFWRYNISNNSWISLEDAPSRVSQGGELVFTGGDHIFAFRGRSNNFWRYSISSDSWSSRANAPASVNYGSDLVYTGGNTIYAFRGGNSQDFWRYNIASNSWSNRQNAPANVDSGGNLVYYTGNFIYALRGNSNTFWRYTISANSWSVLTNTPANVGRGADMVFTHATGGYATRGGNNTDFWEFVVTPPRYDINSQAGTVTTDARIEIDGFTNPILFWDIE